MEKTINIARDYSPILGGRWIRLGPHSGEDFYNTLLEKTYLEAFKKGEKLIIELDRTKGYPSSFLDQSFGELARKYGVENVRKTLELRGTVFKWVIDYINKEIWDKTKQQ